MTALVHEHREFLRGLQSAVGGGLAIYGRSIAANHRAALQAAFPVVERLVGPAFFTEACRAYDLAFPSASGDLHRYGDRFAEFLAGYAPAAALAYLADVATLEWQRHRASLAPDVADFDFGALAQMPQARLDQLRLALHPSVSLLASPFAALALWEANQEGRDGTVEDVAGPERVLVWRDRANAVRAIRLAEAPWRLLEAARKAVPLALAVRAWSEHAPSIGECIAGFARDGVIAACSG